MQDEAPRRRFLIASAAVHGAAAAGMLLWPSAWVWPLAAVTLNQMAVFAGVLTPRSQWIGPVITRTGQAGTVALTFDDGPDPAVTPQVLAILAAAGVTASFFCIGERALAHPALIDAIRAGGHSVENHTARHRNAFAALGPAGLRREVMDAQRALVTPRFFRAPMGFRSPFLAGVLRAAGLRAVAWTRRGYDTVERDPDRVLRRLTAGLAAGDILLLHDGNGARTRGGAPVVLALLPPLLATLRDRGLTAMSLPEACAGTAAAAAAPSQAPAACAST